MVLSSICYVYITFAHFVDEFAHFALVFVVASPDFGGHDSPSTATSFPQVSSPYLPLPKAQHSIY
ncbi:hypothetical protein GmHk_10G028172 [Glycine max]|nr:hypothetical protein GmHk_10G028172 [Glycine max]